MRSSRYLSWVGTVVSFSVMSLISVLPIGAADLQALIDGASPGAEVSVPKGVWKSPIRITKGLTLRGADAKDCVIEVTSNEPAIEIDSREEVALEGITVRWRRATSDGPSATAIFVKDSPVKLRRVEVIAPDSNARCPSGLVVTGFSEAEVTDCKFEGYDFTIQVGNGAKARIAESIVSKPGHCGITVGPNGVVTVTGTIVHGSGYHGMRCTGGELNATDNLVVANKNRGFYLGNKSAAGKIENNLIRDNGTGISGFAASEVAIRNNFIANCDFAGIDMRDSCRLKIEGNAVIGNGRGMAVFKETGTNRNEIGKNALGENKTAFEGFEDEPEVLKVVGDESDTVKKKGYFEIEENGGFGLSEPKKIDGLWARWREMK